MDKSRAKLNLYIVIIGTSLMQLENGVNEAVRSGYIPQGGVCVTEDRISGRLWSQAMILIKE